jgi:putative hydrolase of the HAD superfamily
MKLTPRPKVIFLDAVGTLFGVQGSVGEVYSNLACKHGVTVEPAVLNQAFLQSFRSAAPMAFPGVETAEIPLWEYDWWEAIARQTFQQAGVLEQFSNFSNFFAALYSHFATAAPWFIYADVYRALSYWRSQEIELGVLSNFDTRLHTVLPALGLSEFFTSVTISTEVGAAKPNSKVFAAALEKHRCQPELAWHIGDSFKEDYEGAKAVGIRAIWLKR